MKKNVFVTYDTKAGYYGDPIFRIEPIDSFREGQERLLKLGKYQSTDFILYYVGTYDDLTCSFDLAAQPKEVIDARPYAQYMVAVKENRNDVPRS